MAKRKNVLNQPYHDDKGRERCSSIPTVQNIDLTRSESTEQRIQRILNATLSKNMAERGEETFAEANDFDIEDGFDEDPVSPYPVIDMQEEFVKKESGPPQADPREGDPPEGSPADGSTVKEPPSEAAAVE